MDLISPSKQDEDSDSGSEGSEDEETKKKENKKIEEADWEEDDDEEDEDYEIYSKAIVPSWAKANLVQTLVVSGSSQEVNR